MIHERRTGPITSVIVACSKHLNLILLLTIAASNTGRSDKGLIEDDPEAGRAERVRAKFLAGSACDTTAELWQMTALPRTTCCRCDRVNAQSRSP